jgi:hypothetical protein
MLELWFLTHLYVFFLLLLLAIDRADQRGDVPAYIEFTRLN